MANIEHRTSNGERRVSLPPPPLKRFGQHFLTDPNILRKIIATARVRRDETILEIGPGRGGLTRELCTAAKRVIAVEIDPKLHAYLADQLSDCKNLDLHLGDALNYEYLSLPAGTVVVANLPYYVSTPVLVKLLESRARLDRMVVMLQTEVARRLVAKPGTDAYGRLSVLAQYVADVSLEFQVSPACFRPRPKVGSSVVSLVKRAEPVVQVRDEARFYRVVQASFAHRRKMLPNSLRDEGWQPETVAAALARAGIEPTRRAETCTLGEFAALAAALEMK